MSQIRRSALVLACAVVGYQHAAHVGVAPGGLGHAAGDVVLALPLAVTAVVLARGARRAEWQWVIAAAAFAVLLIPASVVHALMEGAHSHDTAAGLLRHGIREAPASLLAGLPAAWLIAHRVRRISPGFAIALGLLGIASTLVQVRPQPAFAIHEAFTQPLAIPPVLSGPDITISMQQAQVQILPGAPTTMWTYNGVFPGPTIRRPSGQTTQVTFVNNLPDTGNTTVHHHGNHSASSEDGQPHTQLIPPGGSRTYSYDFVEDGRPERAAFQWYHDHVMDLTARNVYMGLAGMVILDDEVDAALPLPGGAYDIPIMVADRTFDADNQLVFTDNATGTRGDHLLVNGVPQPYFEVADRKYRLRLLNASNSSDVEFALSDGAPLIQIATESGLLPAPVSRSSIRLGPAERAEFVVDFNGYDIGEKVVLRNLQGFGETREAMEFRVTQDVVDDSAVPSLLRPVDDVTFPIKGDNRVWLLTQSLVGELEWSINFQTFDPDRIDTAPLNPHRGTAERWVFINVTNVDHVMHIHDVDWRLLLRVSTDPYPADALAVEEAGLKETFRVRPNEIVVVASRFTDHLGTYVFHCHVLEHEDHAMMAQFQVVE